MKRTSIALCTLSLLFLFSSSARADLVSVDRLIGKGADLGALLGRGLGDGDIDKAGKPIKAVKAVRADNPDQARSGAGSQEGERDNKDDRRDNTAEPARHDSGATHERDDIDELLRRDETPRLVFASSECLEALSRLMTRPMSPFESDMLDGAHRMPRVPVPDSVSANPEPGTLILLGTGLVFASRRVAARQRKNNGATR